jgi:CheY-like chemotaxis protein
MPAILLIEDNEPLRDMLVGALSGAGYEVHSAGDGKQGMRLLKTQPVSLLITDIVMPEQDGIETLHLLRRSHPQLPVIAISGDSSRNAALYLSISCKLGAVRTLQKPFAVSVLLEACAQALASAPDAK